MAPKRPTRASSRLNSEPPPNPNPMEGASRQTKSSHGQENSDAEQISPAARIVRDGSAESGLSNGGRVTRKQVKGTAKRLSTVAEDAADDNPNLDPQLKQWPPEYVVQPTKQEDESNDDTGEALQQQRAASSASAVTAQTSFSQRELKELDQDVMLDALPDLCQAAQHIIRLVISGPVESKVQYLIDEDSRAHKNLRRLGKVHTAQKEDFGTGPYINPETAIQGILVAQDGDDAADRYAVGTREIFYLSNLASLLVAAFTDERRAGLIEKLDSEFASLFVIEVDFPRQGVYDYEGVRARTLNLALEIRTHYCLILMSHNLGEQYDPDQIIHQCFFDILEEENDVLKGWDIKGLNSGNLLSNEVEHIRQRILYIQGALSRAGDEDILKSLEDTFKWSDLQAKFIQWAAHRSSGIEKMVNSLGGAEAIRAGIEATKAQGLKENSTGEINTEENSGTQVQLGYLPSEISHPPADTNESTSSMQQIRSLHINPRAVGLLLGSTENGENRRAAEAALSLADDWQPESMEDDHFSPQARRPLSALSQSHEIGLAEQNKENIPELQPFPTSRVRLTDPQANATRVSFDTQEPVQAGPSSKRVFRNPDQLVDHPESEYLPEPSQDEGFQTDTRPSFQTAPIPNMLRNGEEVTPARPTKRPRKSRTTPRARVTAPAARNTPPDQPMNLVPGTQAELYAQVNSQSRLIGSQHQKARKAKEPWTAEEIGALIDYIATFGFLCGKIKEVDEGSCESPGPKRLTRRDNVALKDKARNMKMDYLRSQIALPLNFEEVPLNKALDQRLRDAGIEPPPIIRRGGELIA